MNYLSRPVFDFFPDWSEKHAGGATSHVDWDQEGFGKESSWQERPYSEDQLQFKTYLYDKNGVRSLLSFFDARRGSFEGFWMPSFLGDLRLAGNIDTGNSSFLIEDVGLRDLWNKEPYFGYIAIQSNEVLVCGKILSVVSEGDYERITIQETIGQAFSKSNTIVSWLRYVRFASDELEIEYLTDSKAMATIKTIELPKEYTEASTGQRPVWLYELSGSDGIFRWTSYGTDVTSGGNLFTAADCQHGTIKKGTDFLDEPEEFNISLQHGGEAFQRWIQGSPLPNVSLSIYQIFAPTLTLTSPTYIGGIKKVSIKEKGKITVELSSVLRVSDEVVPRLQFQKFCNWNLFDTSTCRVSASAYQIDTTISDKGGNWIEGSGLFQARATSANDANFFAYGFILCGEERRLVISQDGDRLYLNAPLRDAVVDSNVSAWAGCDKSFTTCQAKFTNKANFGGYPYIPTYNPSLTALAVPQSSSSGGGK